MISIYFKNKGFKRINSSKKIKAIWHMKIKGFAEVNKKRFFFTISV
jgi:hypothetical protein